MTGPGPVTCFPEPETPDLSPARYDDDPMAWVQRSTTNRARAIRAYLNDALAHLPAPASASLCHRLVHDQAFSRVHFELIVGRFLQGVGAQVEHEPVGVGGASVDWRATFPGGQVVYVEATSPQYNQGAQIERQQRSALLGIIEREMPPGWWVYPRNLPRLGPDDPRREFRAAVRAMLRDLPDAAGVTFETRIRREARIAQGTFALELWPGDPTAGPIAMVSMGGWRDDSPLKVAVAARDKRDQARAFPGQVVVLAIDGPFLGPDLEAFDQALFGGTVVHLNTDYGVSHYSFNANGALATQAVDEYAGVLAFRRTGMFGADDPVLYVHPKFTGDLPAELLVLRRRHLNGDVIHDTPATRTGVMDGLGFPDPADD